MLLSDLEDSALLLESEEFCFTTPSLMITETKNYCIDCLLIYYGLFPDLLISSLSTMSFPNVSKGQ